jgi:MAP3K TRAFs-binding domain
MSDKASAPDRLDRVSVENLVQQAASADVAGLMSMWRARDVDQWSQCRELYCAIAQGTLRQGEPLLAYDVIIEALTFWPNDLRLQQLQGLSLACSGATERANAILQELRRNGQDDEETLGMLGRTFKDLATHATDEKDRELFLKRAAETYAQAYEGSGGYWSGINAATMSLLVGEVDCARELAHRVHKQCLNLLPRKIVDDYWLLAALGEAALILGEWSHAEEWYARAAQKGAGRFSDLHSSWRNACLILHYWNEATAMIDAHLRVRPVIVFGGHMIDRPSRSIPRFPATAEPTVAREIRARVAGSKPGFGFASAACGSDILFLEAMLEAGAEISVVLPYNRDEFLRDSVDFIPGSNWAARFEHLLARATRVIVASRQRLKVGGISFEYCNQLLLGLARIRARQLDARLIPLVVWNGQPGDGTGGASDMVKNWQTAGYEPEIIDIEKLLHQSRYKHLARESLPFSSPTQLDSVNCRKQKYRASLRSFSALSRN